MKKEGVPLLNFEGRRGVLLLNFEGGPGVLLLNFRGFPGPGSEGPEVLGPGFLVPLLHHDIHISPNISGSKGAQKMEFDPLIEHNMRKMFVEKIIHKMWWKNYSQTIF